MEAWSGLLGLALLRCSRNCVAHFSSGGCCGLPLQPGSCRTWVAGYWEQVWGQQHCPPAVSACWELRKCHLLWGLFAFLGFFCVFVCLVLGGLLVVFFFFWESFSNFSPFYFSRSCKRSSHHVYPCVLHQCRRVLCCYISGGNNISCLASPQHEKDRVGWQVRIQTFPSAFLGHIYSDLEEFSSQNEHSVVSCNFCSWCQAVTITTCAEL